MLNNYKVVIIDDKFLIRQALIQTIAWEKFNCEVAGEAENGLEAKALIDKLRPELIISDIKMPGMDGLMLAEYVKTILPDTQIIIITGYQEFEYAQKALSLGVCDLVLKPIKNTVMEETIEKAITLLTKHRRIAGEMIHSKKVRQEHFLSEIIKERRLPETVQEEELTSLDLNARSFTLLIARIRTADKNLEIHVKNRIAYYMEDYQRTCGYEILELMNGKNLLLAIFEKYERSARKRRITLKNCLESINEKIKEEFAVSCCFAVSQNSNDVRSIVQSFQQISELLERCFFWTDKNILFMDSYSSAVIPGGSYILQELDQFYLELEQTEETVLKTKIESMVDKIIEETQGDEFRIKCLLSEICITLLRHCRKEVPEEEMKQSINTIMEDISGVVDRKAAGQYLLKFICQLQSRVHKIAMDRNPLAAEAVTYIHKHYNENISLTAVAEYLSTNSSYLSRLLKKETGKNFVDILAECRITRAKQLLDVPGSKVIEVCEQIGYSDYTYFYQVFKRLEKISPSEYKKNGKKI